MPVTQSTNSSTGIGTVANDSTSNYTQDLALYYGPGGGSGSGQGALVQADATAIGTDTFASVDASVTVSDNNTSISVDSLAAAQSPDGSLALTTVNAQVFGQADVVFSLSQSSAYNVTNANGSTSVSQTSIDIETLSFSFGSSDDTSSPLPADSQPPVVSPDDCGCEAGDFTIDGNVAYFAIDATALGDDSYVDVAVDALALEDQFSAVTTVVIVLVG